MTPPLTDGEPLTSDEIRGLPARFNLWILGYLDKYPECWPTMLDKPGFALILRRMLVTLATLDERTRQAELLRDLADLQNVQIDELKHARDEARRERDELAATLANDRGVGDPPSPGWARNDYDPEHVGLAWYRRTNADGTEPGDNDTDATRVLWVVRAPLPSVEWLWEIENPSHRGTDWLTGKAARSAGTSTSTPRPGTSPGSTPRSGATRLRCGRAASPTTASGSATSAAGGASGRVGAPVSDRAEPHGKRLRRLRMAAARQERRDDLVAELGPVPVGECDFDDRGGPDDPRVRLRRRAEALS